MSILRNPLLYAVAAAVVLRSAAALGSPNLSLDDPIYERLMSLREQGRLGPYLHGFRPLSMSRIDELVREAGEPALPEYVFPDSLWVHPLERVLARIQAYRDDLRPYSSVQHPRNVTGAIAFSCEHEEGRPCGNGIGAFTELDSSFGYGPWVSTTIRLQAMAGSDDYHDGVEIDRLHFDGEVGPLALEIGRDVFALGPSGRSTMGWGDHAPALDHLRIFTPKLFALGSLLRGGGVYIVGRLRDPQTYRGNLVSIARAQLTFGSRVEVGVEQLLQLAGEGAPGFGVGDFLLEHVRRRDISASATDSSNRRFGGDVEVYLGPARLYYQLIFEDIRKRVQDALQFDADHLLGAEVGLATACKDDLIIELQKTGARSQEHTPRLTGFTNAGRVVGSPLGPDAVALFIGARIGWKPLTLLPWIELADLSSDTYMFLNFGPITRTAEGIDELRLRGGLRVRVPVQTEWRLELETRVEHVARFDFIREDSRTNFGVMAGIVWQPHGALGRVQIE